MRVNDRGPFHSGRVIDLSYAAAFKLGLLRGVATVELPAGTQPGEVITVRGEGMPSLSRGRRGNLRVVVNVVIPRRLSDEQRDLLERLNGTLTSENLKTEESMFAKLRRALGSQAA